MIEIVEYKEDYAKEMSEIIQTNMYEINIKDHGKDVIDRLAKHFTEVEIKKNYPKRVKNYVAVEENEVVGTIGINKLRGDETGSKYIILTLFVKMEKHNHVLHHNIKINTKRLKVGLAVVVKLLKNHLQQGKNVYIVKEL